MDGLLAEYDGRAHADPANVSWWGAIAGLAVLRSWNVVRTRPAGP